jgi:two-component system response regulator DevR
VACIRVVLVDDHCVVREGLRSILDPDPRFEVVGEASSGTDALRVVAEQRPEAVLLDVKLPDISGVEVCQHIVQESPQTAVLILTAFFDPTLVNACMQAGARGYLLKDAEGLNLPEKLLAAVHGHAALDPRAADVLVGHVYQHGPPAAALSLREMEALRLIAQGLTNKEIGGRLHLSESAVKGCVSGVLAKLDARNRTEVVLLARERGLL